MITTLEYANRLKDAGMESKMAETFATLQDELRRESDTNLVTKKDLSISIKELEITLIKWMIGISIGQFAILVGVIKLIK